MKKKLEESKSDKPYFDRYTCSDCNHISSLILEYFLQVEKMVEKLKPAEPEPEPEPELEQNKKRKKK